MQARQARRWGVSSVTASILEKLEKEEGVNLGKKLRLLSVGLREYTREERKRVRATVAHVERVVEFLRHKMMRYPGDKRAQSRLVCKEAHLEAYLQSCKDRMQVLAGIRVELNGEVPSPYLSAKIKMRKKRTVIRELTHQGAAYLGTKNVLRAVAEHFKLAFSEIEPEEEVDWETFAKGATLSDAEVERLAAEWLEAEVYSPPDKVWEKIRTISHAFVSAGEAVEEKIFILWRAYLAYLPRKDGGLGQLNPKLCLDGLAVRRVGKLLQEPEGARRWLAEKAAGFPQGWATLHAHPSATKLWQAGSVRWKAAVKIFWKSPFAELPAPANRWEVEEELIGFKRRIMHRGGSPFGHQIGTAGLINLRIKDLLTDGPGGRRCVKAVELLTLELGSKEGAGMALKAYEAMPLERKAMVEEPASAEAQVATPGVVRYVLWGEPSGPPWAVKGIDGTQAIYGPY
ncbi:unnamed protein product [Closterium sp. NIES-64]|nr:unnamed protein product [Closterium sp. NIES-64]